jgi:hypothetical protein
MILPAMHEALGTIQTLVAPVVMISACGLLCLALYNRLAAIVARARAFHKEWFDASGRLRTDREENDASIGALRERATLLEAQVRKILSRAKLIRNALICLILTVMCMLFCSVALGLSPILHAFAHVALVSFAFGVGSMFGAMLLALIELLSALDPVMMEQETIENLETSWFA